MHASKVVLNQSLSWTKKERAYTPGCPPREIACLALNRPSVPISQGTTIQGSSASSETSDNLALLNYPRRTLVRLLDNVPWLVPGVLPPFMSLPILTGTREWIALIYFSFRNLS